jgi:hypothetical protein
LAALVTDFAKIQLMKMLHISAHSVAGRPASSLPVKKLAAVRERGVSAYIAPP